MCGVGKALLTLVKKRFVIGLLMFDVLLFMANCLRLNCLWFNWSRFCNAIVVSIVGKRFRAVSKRIQQTYGSLTSSVWAKHLKA